MKRAKKSDWKTVEMPEETASFPLDLELTREEYSRLQYGHIPQGMEDKWFSWFENDTLFVHRSRTGFCIYRIRFSKEGKVLDVLVNRSREQYLETSMEKDRIQAMICINSLANRPGNAELMMKFIKG